MSNKPSIAFVRQQVTAIAASVLVNGVDEVKIDVVSVDRPCIVAWCGPARTEQDDNVGFQVICGGSGYLHINIVDGFGTSDFYIDTLEPGEAVSGRTAGRVAEQISRIIAHTEKRIARREKQHDRWAA